MNMGDVENLAELAKLELSSEEKEAMLSDVGGILGYVRQIESVDVGDVTPEYQTYNVWREDVLRASGEVKFSKEIIIDQFPSSQDGFLKVKKII